MTHGHKFSPQNIKRIQYPKRFQEEPFEELKPLLELGNKKVIVDLGCGIVDEHLDIFRQCLKRRDIKTRLMF